MQIETERLLIRDFIEADFEPVYAYGSDPAVVRYMVFPPSRPEGTREHWARCMRQAHEEPRTAYDRGVVLKATNQVIGGISLARVMEKCGFCCEDGRDGERFYALTVAEWKKMVQHETL